ncbi:MAG: hypothetical protein KDB07_08545, partial [Planctomycetes bacterium]|nr:hypothetical protein [Planctomycetota bacterium]
MKNRITALALLSCVALGLVGCHKDETSHSHAGHSHELHADAGHAHDHEDGHVHAGHGHDHNYAHSCSLRSPMGLRASHGRNGVVSLIGVAQAPQHVENDIYTATIRVEQMLQGSAEGTVTVTIQADHEYTGIVAGERMLFAFVNGEDGLFLSDVHNGVVRLAASECQGAEELATTLIGANSSLEARKDAVLNAIINGGDVTRFRAVHDFSFDFYEVMTQSDWDRLLGHVRGISEWDPSQNFLIYGVAMSGKPEVTSALMGLCDKPARTKVFEDLA